MKRSNEDTRSSQIFFTARVKNKREDTKLKYELKQLEREFGHTIFSIHKDIRDLKAELKITKRSSGHSSEGWFAQDDEDAEAMANHKLRPTKSAGGERPRNKVLGHHRQQTRVSSAPAVGNSRDISMVARVTKRNVRESDKSISNSVSGKRQTQKAKVTISKKHGMRTTATKIVPANQISTPTALPHVNEEKVHGKSSESEPGDIFPTETEKEHSRTGLQLVNKTSFLNPISITNSEAHDEIKLETSNVPSPDLQLSVNKPDERPLSAKMTQFVKERWLKPTLKSRTNGNNDMIERPKKTVRIAPNTANYQESNSSKASGKTLPATSANMKTPFSQDPVKTTTFMTESQSFSADSPHETPLLQNASSRITGNSSNDPTKKHVNVIPDVRKKVLSTDEIKMKRKRDNLLASSVSALLAGKVLGRKSTEGCSENEKGEESEDRPITGAENGRSPSPKLRRRFSFGTITMLAMNQHKTFPVEKKATLGSRLKLKTPAEESEHRNIDIKKSVLVNDSDSDDDRRNDYSVPAKPVIDLANVKSKISNQWNQDAVLEKPPTLAEDTFQLQRSLAAAHISRGRDLREMQDENDTDPIKAIDDDRKSALMMKLKVFNNLISGGNKQESRRKSVMDAIHAGTDGKQILKLMRLANQN